MFEGHTPLASFLAIPLPTGKSLTGGEGPVRRGSLLAVANRPGGYTPDHQQLLEVFATPAAVLVEQLAREEREGELKAQLRQAQKMEAVGRLAGGIAHDFNNLLTAIMGYSHLLLAEVSANDPLAAGLQEINKAGERAVALTRQLLAFGRKTTEQPRAVDLNHLVNDLHKMLCRLIGEDIELTTQSAAGLHTVHGDPCQLEQVVVNLAVNARDAIQAVQRPGGPRKVTIQTANVRRATDDPLPAGVTAGDYVEVSVRDTGCGMTDEVRKKIFEPFFTTKEQRNGTGLGLATVAAIVKQSNGHIDVTSEPDRGTTFSVYLPAAPAAAPDRREAPAVLERKRGTETLLILEDDANLRLLLQQLFRPCGFALLFAPTGEDALRLAEEHAGPIDLLIADVVLPRLTGPEVANRLKKSRPSLRSLFISGYSPEVIGRRAPLPPGAPFLQKPFTPSAILRMVRGILDYERPPPAAHRSWTVTTETSSAPAG